MYENKVKKILKVLNLEDTVRMMKFMEDVRRI
jgi:hypothetical protein